MLDLATLPPSMLLGLGLAGLALALIALLAALRSRIRALAALAVAVAMGGSVAFGLFLLSGLPGPLFPPPALGMPATALEADPLEGVAELTVTERRPDVPRWQGGQAVAAYLRGEAGRPTEDELQTALLRAQLRKEPLGAAWALCGLGEIAYARGDLAHAEGHFSAALAHFTAAEDEAGMARALIHLGLTARAQGDETEAASHFADALAIDERQGSLIGVEAELAARGLR